MNLEAIEKVYRRYAPSYDFYFGAVLQPGRRKVIERMNCRPGERILEVGVGTGLSLPLYPRNVHVTGIDVSREMLARAHDRVAAMHLDNVTLQCMDAESMTFPDDSFDKVVAMYVVSVVPSPGRLVAEMRRVCKPGASLYVVNHFRQSNPVVSMLERMMAPFSGLVGFHPDFSLEHFVEQTGFTAAENIPVNLFGYWTLLRSRNDKRG
ncbi:MAG: class I SAM-dependent methyltransferase [Betaproteobacteria bacterium]|nr:class I SAM-dependent methyltransferase [Betaproteobacteria bacterium]